MFSWSARILSMLLQKALTCCLFNTFNNGYEWILSSLSTVQLAVIVQGGLAATYNTVYMHFRWCMDNLLLMTISVFIYTFHRALHFIDFKLCLNGNIFKFEPQILKISFILGYLTRKRREWQTNDKTIR